MDREHPAALAGDRHQPAALQRQGMQVLRADAAGGAQGRQFAIAVAGEGVGAKAERLQHAPGAEAHGAERRLGRVSGAQGVLVGGPLLRREGAQRINQTAEARPCLPSRGEGAIRLGQRLMRGRECAYQIAQHSRILGALPGEQHGQLARRSRPVAGAVRAAPRFHFGLPGQQRPRPGDHFPQVRLAAQHRQHQPASGPRVPGCARVGGAGTQFFPRQIGRPRRQPGVQRGRVVAAECEELHVAVPIDLRFIRFGLFEDAMKVAAAEAEGADAGPPRSGPATAATAASPC